MDDTIYRQVAIKALNTEIIKRRLLDDVNDGMLDEFDTESILRALPSADVIPVEWIEEQIKRLTEMDNGFAHLAAGNISSLLKTWREKDDE